jgi:hypothetical protein
MTLPHPNDAIKLHPLPLAYEQKRSATMVINQMNKNIHINTMKNAV